MADDRCREVLRKMCAEVGRPVDSPFCREVLTHISECASCRDQAVTLRGTVSLVHCLQRREVPEHVVRSLRSTLGLP